MSKKLIIFNIFKSFIAKPEGFFVIFAAFFGLILVFLVPPMHAPDEIAHLFKSYQVSDLSIAPTKFYLSGVKHYGYPIPISLGKVAGSTFASSDSPGDKFDINLYKQYLSMPLSINKTVMIANESASIYSPVAYIPQAIGINIGKIFNTSPLLLIWFGRITNLACWIMIVFFAVRQLPFAKWGMVVLALNPVALSLAASLSGDAINIGLAFLFVSLVLSTRRINFRMNYKAIWSIIIVAVLLALTKPTNCALLLLLLLVPINTFSQKKYYFIFLGTVFATSIGACMAWNFSVIDINTAMTKLQRPDYNIMPSKQLANIIDHPINYIKIIIHNYVIAGPGMPGNTITQSYFGTLGWSDVFIPFWVQILYIICLFLTAIYQFGNGIAISYKGKILLFSTFLISALGTVTAMYLSYTSVGLKAIEGVQGRYFIPTSVALLGIFTGKNKLFIDRGRAITATVFIILIVVYIITLVARYY